MEAAGGTELQLKFLYDHVDNDLLNTLQSTNNYFRTRKNTITS